MWPTAAGREEMERTGKNPDGMNRIDRMKKTFIFHPVKELHSWALGFGGPDFSRGENPFPATSSAPTEVGATGTGNPPRVATA
jgi:hypothetical protein